MAHRSAIQDHTATTVSIYEVQGKPNTQRCLFPVFSVKQKNKNHEGSPKTSCHNGRASVFLPQLSESSSASPEAELY